MTKLISIPILLLMATLIAGCAINDPGGMTTRQTIRSQSDSAIAQEQARAAIAVAEAEARGAVAVAEQQADAQKAVALQETVRTGIVAAVVPWVVLIVVGGVVVGIVVWWQGKIWYKRTEMIGPAPALPMARPVRPGLAELRRLAAAQGYELEIDGDVAYLVDNAGRRVARRLLG